MSLEKLDMFLEGLESIENDIEQKIKKMRIKPEKNEEGIYDFGVINGYDNKDLEVVQEIRKICRDTGEQAKTKKIDSRTTEFTYEDCGIKFSIYS
jgi:hypothetical protein